MVITRGAGEHIYLTYFIDIAYFCVRLITMLHALHRSTYMGERTAYYERRQEVSVINIQDNIILL